MIKATPPETAIVIAGGFLLFGMITGVWKYLQMMRNENHTANEYVNIAHRASLLYAPATLVLGALAWVSTLSPAIEYAAIISVSAYFAIAVASYVYHGAKGRADTQFADKNLLTTYGMYSLIAVEIGGTLILLVGAVLALLS